MKDGDGSYDAVFDRESVTVFDREAVTDISRWSSTASTTGRPGTPPGCGRLGNPVFRGYRCAQPPANFCEPYGFGWCRSAANFCEPYGFDWPAWFGENVPVVRRTEMVRWVRPT